MGASPKEEKFFYCLKHGEPQFHDGKWCKTCFDFFRENNRGQSCALTDFPCKKGFKYSVGEGIANVLNSLTKEELKIFLENQRKSKAQTFESFKSENHNIYDISSGLWYISALEKGLAEGVDLFLSLNISIDAVEVRKKGSTFKKVYPVWIIINDLPIDLRFPFSFFQKRFFFLKELFTE